MKSFIFPTVCIAATIALAPTITKSFAQNAPSETAPVQFTCASSPDPSSRTVLPATVANVPGSPEATVLFVWKSEFFGTKFAPQQRCQIVSAKIQTAFQEGRIYLGSGIDKATGSGIICGIADPKQQCDRSNMILTMKTYQNAEETIDKISDIMKGKTGRPIYQGSGGKRVNLRDLSFKKR
jgi:Circadian oscillating protein COP23